LTYEVQVNNATRRDVRITSTDILDGLENPSPVISHHRYALQPTNGTLRTPEHFAIDFTQLEAQARLFTATWTGWPTRLPHWAPSSHGSSRNYWPRRNQI
jgi:hypothetical protein